MKIVVEIYHYSFWKISVNCFHSSLSSILVFSFSVVRTLPVPNIFYWFLSSMTSTISATADHFKHQLHRIIKYHFSSYHSPNISQFHFRILNFFFLTTWNKTIENNVIDQFACMYSACGSSTLYSCNINVKFQVHYRNGLFCYR